MSAYKILKEIRAKFIGTAEEHDLLRELIDDISNIEEKVTKRVEELWRERNENLREAEKRIWALSDARRVDIAITDWLRAPESGYSLPHLIDSMRGAGLTAKHLETLLVEMNKREKKSD